MRKKKEERAEIGRKGQGTDEEGERRVGADGRKGME